MNNRRRQISGELKAKILAESYKERCVIAVLAKSYGISKETVNRWRRQERLEESRKESIINKNTGFVELAVQKAEQELLRKVELVFSNFSVLLEGKVSSNQLLKILEALEVSC